MYKTYIVALLISLCALRSDAQPLRGRCISGIYPHLAYFNNEGECGTGAVVPWAGRLWVVTYGPHQPYGSSDKLYAVDSLYRLQAFAGSVGGTHANRMVHRETGQLLIGPYVIDGKGNIRVLDRAKVPGRFTGVARSLADGAQALCLATMEQGFYSIDMKSLNVTIKAKDGNQLQREGAGSFQGSLVAGVHGKGFYSGQGVYVYTNNGEDVAAPSSPNMPSGSLSEYDGKDWKLVRRNQFTEVTGPGGIYGAVDSAHDPIWALGWDAKSVILAVRDYSYGWSFFRIPKASNTYDGVQGWNTEWPRIRNVGTPNHPYYLMTMHGMFWYLPQTFSVSNAAGLRPLTSYLKVIGDFCSWNGNLVFGCDDSARDAFQNQRKLKGIKSPAGQSQSNLWFTPFERPLANGTKDAQGCVWAWEDIPAHSVSEPFLLAGWKKRRVWIENAGTAEVAFTFETDRRGDGHWRRTFQVVLPSGQARCLDIDTLSGEWIRVSNSKATRATVVFLYSDETPRPYENAPVFAGLSSVHADAAAGGLLYALGNNSRQLGIVATAQDGSGSHPVGYYEMDERMNINKVENPSEAQVVRTEAGIPKNQVGIERASYLVVDDQNRRWRFPVNEMQYHSYLHHNSLRICREVSTERDLFNLGGTFYELPADNAGGFAKVRPVATHHLAISDYCSYRGLLILTGVNSNAPADGEHLFESADGKCKVWVGALDDLWKMGKPVGHGGPWMEDSVRANVPSDAFLMSLYDKKELRLSHASGKSITVTVQLDVTGDGNWMNYKQYKIKPHETFTTTLPDGYLARWIRFISDTDTKATALLFYN